MKINQDQLGKITDEELRSRFSTIKKLIDSKKNSKPKLKQLEIEYCYLYREMDLRRSRRTAHENFAPRRNTRK